MRALDFPYNLLIKQLSVMYLIPNFLQHPDNLIFLEKKTLIAENHQSFILAEVRGYGALTQMILKTSDILWVSIHTLTF